MWALRKILRISYTRHITNDEVRSRSNCQPLSSIVTSRRLRFFNHIARSSPDEDHHHCCRDTQASSGLEKARRETQSHLVTFGGGRPETSEHWSFFCVEKSFWAAGLAPHLEEYAIRRRRSCDVMLTSQCIVNTSLLVSTGAVPCYSASMVNFCLVH